MVFALTNSAVASPTLLERARLGVPPEALDGIDLLLARHAAWNGKDDRRTLDYTHRVEIDNVGQEELKYAFYFNYVLQPVV